MKKLISCLLIGLLIVQFGFAAPSTWAQDAILKLKLQGVLDGTLSNNAKMTQNITRQEFAEMAVRLYVHVTGLPFEALAKQHNFTDTTNPYVGVAYNLGIVKGFSETKFAPNDQVTREQIATMLHRQMTLMDLAKSHGSTILFADQAKVSDWATEGVTFSKYHGLVNGIGNNTFAPQAQATREQVMKIIDNILVRFSSGLQTGSSGSRLVNGFYVPSTQTTTLVVSEKKDQGILLRLQSGIAPADRSAVNIQKEWMDLYHILIQHLSYEGAEKVITALSQAWDATALSYETTSNIYVLSDGTLTTKAPTSGKYVTVYTQGIALIELK